MARAEQPHFLIDRRPIRRHRRAQDNERGRGIERRNGGISQRAPTGEVLAIPKDRSQRLRDRPDGGVAANPILVDATGFERTVQPLRPPRIVVAVTQERVIFECRDLRHDILPRSPDLSGRPQKNSRQSAAWRVARNDLCRTASSYDLASSTASQTSARTG